MPDRLRAFIESTGLNLKMFSAKCGIPYRTLQDYLAGKIVPGGENLQRMSTVFSVSVDWILVGKGPMYLQKGLEGRIEENKEIHYEGLADLIIDYATKLKPNERKLLIEHLFEGFSKNEKQDKKKSSTKNTKRAKLAS